MSQEVLPIILIFAIDFESSDLFIVNLLNPLAS